MQPFKGTGTGDYTKTAPASSLPTMRSLTVPQPSLLGIPIELRNAICHFALEDFVIECRSNRAGLLPYKPPGLLMVSKLFYRQYISMFHSLAIFADTYDPRACIERMQRLRRLRPDLAALITRARVKTSKLRDDDDWYELDVYYDQCRAIDLHEAYSREFPACNFEVRVLGPDDEQIWTDSPWKTCFDSPDGRPWGA